MWSPPSTCKDLDAGSPPYCRPLPRRSRPLRTAAAADRHHPSPFRSAVPFSWEHRPGIPKTPGPRCAARSIAAPLLPLPPPFASASHKKGAVAPATPDPFATALAECAKSPPRPTIEELFARSGSAAGRRRRVSVSWSLSDRLGLFGLHHASCKATCAVADSAVHVPRFRSRTGARP